jgi:DNA-binding NarL/FixJ family response regulator
MENLKNIKVLIVDDNKRDLQLLEIYLNKILGVEMVMCAESGKEAIKTIKKIKFDVVLMDKMMDVMDGVEATREIRKLDKKIKVLACSGTSDENSIIRMIQAGANGYLDKTTKVDEYGKAIYTVMKVGIYFNDIMTIELYERAMEDIVFHNNISNILLHDDDKKLLRYISKKMNNIAIGDAVGLSYKSVPRLKSNVKKKIGAEDDLDVLVFSLKNKLIHISEL